ncbi:HD domain-containing phosphohydrolase [Marinitoga lauensis]|uniref:HD domain-containing phosphohydrolase n=1 Tax=Marinitoga lauensis TaxID=2201189 RepID=UPI001981E455|nr:HD domain-containing phosphohydrolase [Marinitoga lauensis]
MTLKFWLKKILKKTLIILISILFLVSIILVIFNIQNNLNKRIELQYNKINKTIDFQKKRIINNIKLISRTYSYSIDNKSVLKNMVENNKSIDKVIDYKPTFDEINEYYPDDNMDKKIKEYIKQNLKLLEEGKLKVFNFKNNIIFIAPYFYYLENIEIFEGVLIYYMSKEYLLSEIKIGLVENEYIKPYNKKSIFTLSKEFDFYSEKYYYILDYSNDVYLLIMLTIILMCLSFILYEILKIMFFKNLENEVIKPIEEFSDYIKQSGNLYEKEIFIDEFDNLRKSYNNLLIEIEEQKNEIEASYEEATAANEVLIETTKQLEFSISRFEGFIKLIGNLALSNISEKEFFNTLLKTAINLIPGVDYGSIVIRENGKWRFISSYGHDYDILKNIEIPDNIFVYVNKTQIIENILEEDKVAIQNEEIKKIFKASKPFVKSIFSPLKINDYVIGQISLDAKKDVKFDDEAIKVLETFTIISSIFIRLRRISKEEGQLHKNIILVLVKALEYYDKYTKGHSERVANIATEFAEYLGISHAEIKKVYWSGITHDIGKFFIPQTILNKPGKLNDEEYEIIKQHPIKSYELLASNPYLSEYSKIVKHHHERWDGEGYPDGLKGEKIPYISRIIMLADSFDAMITIRPYKKALSIQDAIEDIKKNSGSQFDPELAEKFIEYLRRKYL